MSFNETYERMRARIEREQNIYCPWCGELASNDDGQWPCTYHGYYDNREIHEMECGSCEEIFFIKEIVNREYEEAKNKEEFE